MSAQNLDYKGARLNVRASGSGWSVFVFLPGAVIHEATVPNTRDPGGKNDVLAQAKRIVDAALG